MEAIAGWYYLRDGGSFGPEPAERLLELLDGGGLTRATPIWRQGESDWQPLERGLGLLDQAPPPVPGAPPIVSGTPQTSVSSVRTTLVQERHRKSAQPLSKFEDAPAHPWRRYFARMVDLAVGGGLAWMLFGFALGAVDQDAANNFFTLLNRPQGRFIDLFGTVFLAIFPCALVIGFTGSSLGKVIFGVRVTRSDGTPIGFTKGLAREFRVWLSGLGLGIPLVNLFAMIGSHHRLKKTGTTSWDEALSVRVSYRRSSALQWVLNVTGVLLWFACFVGINVLNRL